MKNEKQHRLLFIIPAVIIAIILIICIAVAVSSKSGEKGKKKDSRSVSVTENAQDIVAESETLELVKKDALKESNIVDKDNKQNDKQNNGTQSAANDNSAPAAGNSDNANTASEKSSEKSSGDKAAAGKKSSTGSDNTPQPAGNDSKPAASNQTATPEPAQSEPAQPEAPKNEYVAPGWIFYGSKAGNGMSGEQKAYIDSVIQQWTNGGLSDDAIGDIGHFDAKGLNHVLNFHAVLIRSANTVRGNTGFEENLVILDATDNQIGISNINCQQHITSS